MYIYNPFKILKRDGLIRPILSKKNVIITFSFPRELVRAHLTMFILHTSRGALDCLY